MTNDSQNEDGIERPDRTVEIKEGLWIVAMSCIGLLFIALLHQSSQVMGQYSESGKVDISVSFWVLATIYLAASISVFPLLKDSKPIEFKVTAYIFTGVVPIAALLMLVFNLLKLGI